MWYPKSFQFLCIFLLLFIVSSRAFCQTLQIAPVRGAFSADSGKVKATRVQVPLHPIRIDRSLQERGVKAIPIEQPQESLLSPSTEEPWVSLHLSSTQSEWNIRRPGDYATQSIFGSIMGNVDILIIFSGFEDLNSSNPNTEIVETYYAVSVGNQSVEEVNWASASDFNSHTLLIEQDPNSPTTVDWGLWNRVCVKTVNTATDYSDDAVITFVMQNTSPWVDP